MDVIAKLTKEQFLTWRLALEKMGHAKALRDYTRKVAANQMLQIENQQLKTSLYRSIINSKEAEFKQLEEEFVTARKTLEAELGFEIKDVVFDEITLEVRREEQPKISGDK